MTRLPILCALAALAVLPAPARAATIIGSTTGAEGPGFGPATYLQTGDPTGKSFAVPAGGGVITGVSAEVKGDGGVQSTVRVLTFRGTGSSTIAGHADITFTGDNSLGVESAPARIRVRAGDRLGAFVPATATISLQASSGTVRAYGGDGPPADGATLAGGVTNPGGVLVAATVEPDADGDGYGDETQDSCAADPTVHTGACTTDLTTTLRARPTTIPRNDVSVLIGTVTAARRAPGATARLQLPAGLQLVVASTTGGECIAFTCSLGDIPAGQQRKVYVTVRALGSGLQTARLSASSSLVDRNTADNTATTQVQVSKQRLTTRPKLCKVPDLEGRKRKAARRALTRADCRPGKVKGRKGRRARVRHQAVPAGVRVAAGTKIGFRLKRKPEQA